MGEENDEIVKDKTTRLLELIPFMSEFPFDDYEITIEDFGLPLDQLGISPILINELGANNNLKRVDFYYAEGESSVSISLRKDDIEWLASESPKITKFDDLCKEIEEALKSTDLACKMKSIRSGRKFLRNFSDPNLQEVDFNETMSEFLEIYSVQLDSKTKLVIQNLNMKAMAKTELVENKYLAVRGFLNFQLNYIKIVLGIVIATKIY
jgi:hypothetical protein